MCYNRFLKFLISIFLDSSKEVKLRCVKQKSQKWSYSILNNETGYLFNIIYYDFIYPYFAKSIKDIKFIFTTYILHYYLRLFKAIIFPSPYKQLWPSFTVFSICLFVFIHIFCKFNFLCTHSNPINLLRHVYVYPRFNVQAGFLFLIFLLTINSLLWPGKIGNCIWLETRIQSAAARDSFYLRIPQIF